MMVFHDETTLPNSDLPVVQYRIWSLWERKLTSLVLLSLIFGLTFAVYVSTEKTYLALAAGILLLGSVGRMFVPMQFEMTTEGITRWTLGYRRSFPWADIHSYVLQEEGILILPHRIRYPLDAFRGVFIPIPQKYRIAVQRRFLFFVEKSA